MAIKDTFIAELKQESALTIKMLERVPMDKKDWKPHDKSMTLGQLSSHVADIPHWVSDIIHIDEFDFQKHYKPFSAGTSDELLKMAGDIINRAMNDLEKMEDEDFKKMWLVKSGDKVYFNLPKVVAIRGWAYSHLYHHRGQLSVYLRLLDVPVPGMYGPTADEPM